MKQILFAISIIFLMASCNKEVKVDVNYILEFDGDPLVFDKKYTNVSGYEVKFSVVKFYTTSIKLNEMEITDAFLYDHYEPDQEISKTIEPQSFNTISFDIGVEEERNNADPTQYEADHALSTYSSNGMHWTWNTGYIFIMIEGTYNAYPEIADSSKNFLLHIGNNENLKSFSANFDLEIGKKNNGIVNIGVDLSKVFYNETETIDLKTHNYTHSEASNAWLTDQVAKNFANSFYVKSVDVVEQ